MTSASNNESEIALPANANSDGNNSSAAWRVATGMFLALWTVIAVVFVFYGHYIEDEGFYCLISRDVWRGRALYADIRFTQTPFLPYVYGAFLQFLPARIESGRLVSLLLSVGGLAIAWKMLADRYGPAPALFGIALIGVSKAFVLHMVAVMTPPLTFFLGVCSLYFLSRFDLALRPGATTPEQFPSESSEPTPARFSPPLPKREGKESSGIKPEAKWAAAGEESKAATPLLVRDGRLAKGRSAMPFIGVGRLSAAVRSENDPLWNDPMVLAALAGLFAGASLLTRLSTLPLAVGVPLVVLYRLRGHKAGWTMVAAAVAGAVVLPASVLLGCAGAAAGRFWFDIYGYNTALGQQDSPIVSMLEFVLQVMSDNAASLLLMLAATAVLFVTALRRSPIADRSPLDQAERRRHASQSRSMALQSSPPERAFEVSVALMWWAITIIHATRRPSFSVYQISIAWGPLLIGAWAAQKAARRSGKAAWVGLYLLILAGTLAPEQEDALIGVQARRPAGIYEASAPIRAMGRVRLITFDSGIAFCAPQARLMQGYEMSEFSLAPDWVPDGVQVDTRGVSQPKLLADVRVADVIALNSRPLTSIDHDVLVSLTDYIHQNFHQVAYTGNYGQFPNDFMVILVRNPTASALLTQTNPVIPLNPLNPVKTLRRT